jgi:hypothetical protein
LTGSIVPAGPAGGRIGQRRALQKILTVAIFSNGAAGNVMPVIVRVAWG